MPLSVRDRGNGLPHRSPTAIQDDSTRLILQVFQHKSCASWNILWSVGYFRFIQCAKPARCIDGNYKITPGCETLSQVSVTLVTWHNHEFAALVHTTARFIIVTLPFSRVLVFSPRAIRNRALTGC